MSRPANHNPAGRRTGLTLVELMVAVAIIGVLASILVGVAAVAGVTAREAQTKSMITRLHTLLIERFDGYRTRRIELAAPRRSDTDGTRQALNQLAGVDVTLLPQVRASLSQTGGTGDPRVVAIARVAGLRELMKLEMPDRWSDVYGQALPTGTPPPGINTINPVPQPNRFLAARPALWSQYAREYNRVRLLTNTLSGSPNTREDLIENQGAELLYLTIINATGNGQARGLFREQDTGDTDGDGALEFLDGWGQPISLVRWPAGYESDLQLDAPRLASLDDATVAELVLEDHDPYDLFRVDNPAVDNPRGWRQTPLIVSAGRDGELGLVLNPEPIRPVDPFAEANGGGWLGGFDTDPETAADNVHNHALSGLTRTR